jgi:hypothetical protein
LRVKEKPLKDNYMNTLSLYKAFKAMGAPDEAAEQAAAAVE